MKLKISDKIRLSSGLEYEIIEIYDGGYYDLKALKPEFDWMLDFYPIYYSIRLQNYTILTS